MTITAGDMFRADARDSAAAVATISEDASMAELLDLLCTRRLSSAPVVGSGRGGDASEAAPAGQYVGAVDVLDVIGALLAEDVEFIKEVESGEGGGSRIDPGEAWRAREAVFRGRRVSGVMGLSPTNPLVSVRESDPLDDVLARFSLEARRVTLLGGEGGGDPLAVLSAWGVVSFLAARPDLIVGAATRGIGQVDAGRPVELVCATTQSTALDALEAMYSSVIPIFGTPIIDEGTGCIVDVLSATDVSALARGAGDPALWSALRGPVRAFLGLATRIGHTRPRGPVVCHASASVLDVARAMAEFRVHRVFVVAESVPTGIAEVPVHPVGVVSALDVIEDAARARANVQCLQSAVGSALVIRKFVRSISAGASQGRM